MPLLSVLWALVGQKLGDARTPQEVALAAQVVLGLMLFGLIACPIALYFACINQHRREQRQRAVAAEYGDQQDDQEIPEPQDEFVD
ncbi:MAG: hypothetical protein AB7W28_04240 [Armatimonadota bacterium]